MNSQDPSVKRSSARLARQASPYLSPFFPFISPLQADFKWQAQFGHVIRLKGILGVRFFLCSMVPLADFDLQTDRLLISDPKALHYMYSSGYNIRKHAVRSEITRLATGEGLAWANSSWL
jgi:hypothetical protein